MSRKGQTERVMLSDPISITSSKTGRPLLPEQLKASDSVAEAEPVWRAGSCPELWVGLVQAGPGVWVPSSRFLQLRVVLRMLQGSGQAGLPKPAQTCIQ